MATELKLRRGTTNQHSSFTGAEAEVTVDTDKETVVVHDGATVGGYPVAREDMSNVPDPSFDSINVDSGTLFVDSANNRVDINGFIKAGPFGPVSGTAGSVALGLAQSDVGFFRPGFNIIGISTSGTEAARIDSSGNLLVGTASYDSLGDPTVTINNKNSDTGGIRINGLQAINGEHLRLDSQFNGIAVFSRQEVTQGSIEWNGTGTSYNTSSDYRLKENVTELSDGIERLKKLPVHRFNFIASPSNTVDGFLAHEVQPYVPEAVTGQKDAVDEDGKPKYQGIDQAKLVPVLTAALQEAVARIETLEAEVASLKNA